MGSRYTTIKPQTYCYKPLHIFNNGVDTFVPCGKCDGCLLHKANDWSMRLGSEMESGANNIFFTLTYDNKYIPHLTQYDYFGSKIFLDYNPAYPNIRFNSSSDVRRLDFWDMGYLWRTYSICVPISRIPDNKYLPYLSKVDIQLWLKLVRKSINKFFPKYENNRFRYFIIGEYGPTSYRPHYHGVILCESHEVSEYLIECGLFENWQMCRKDLFDQYVHYCDSGAKGYVTQYLTCFSSLPKVLKDKSIRPFRLSSKGCAIGFDSFDKDEVYENVFNGVIEYTKTISRINEQSLLRYPSGLINSLFPKCYEYRKLSFDGLLRLYSRLYRIARRFPRYVEKVGLRSTYNRLYSDLHPVDYQCSKACLDSLSYFGHPFNYVYALDMCYYKLAMYNLKFFYEQQNLTSSSLDALRQYDNVTYYVNEYRNNAMSPYRKKVFEWFLSPFGLHLSDFDTMSSEEVADILKYRPSEDYVNEVSDIFTTMEKMPKFNILNQQSPNNNF